MCLFLNQCVGDSCISLVDLSQRRGLELGRVLHERFDNRADTALWNLKKVALQPSRCQSLDNLGEVLDKWEDIVRQCESGGDKFKLSEFDKEVAIGNLVPAEVENT